MKMTTEQIIHHIEKDIVPADWAWEYTIESACDESCVDAADAVRFLESFEPCREWSAAEYHGLMCHHFSGRWESAAHIAHIRLGEWIQERQELLDERKKRYSDDTVELSQIEADRDRAVSYHARWSGSDELAVQWLKGRFGTYVFDCPDGSVLVFDRIFGGIIDAEEPS